MKKNLSIEEKALVKAAKLICNLKFGLCPIAEPDFSGCPQACSEKIRPWQCWVAHLSSVVRTEDDNSQPDPLLKLVV